MNLSHCGSDRKASEITLEYRVQITDKRLSALRFGKEYDSNQIRVQQVVSTGVGKLSTAHSSTFRLIKLIYRRAEHYL